MGDMHMISKSPETVWISWGGDVNVGRRFHYAYQENTENFCLGNISVLQRSDLNIVNLECVIATHGQEGLNKGERASYYYRARPEMLSALRKANIQLVATANNHSGDYGSVALMEQAQWLKASGIDHAGSGSTLKEAFTPVIRRVKGVTIAFFAIDSTQRSFAATEFAAGHAFLDINKPDVWYSCLKPLIAEARQVADVVLVAIHWGANNEHSPSHSEISVGHAVVDAGADAILGSSAHVLQGIEIYKDRPIIHDAGDLLFDAIRRSDKDTAIFTLEVSRLGVEKIYFTPLEIGFCTTTNLDEIPSRNATRRYAKKCEEFGTSLHVMDNGAGVLDLHPPIRPILQQGGSRDFVSEKPYQQPLHSPQSAYVVDAVPEDIKLSTPIKIGPLELVGVRISPEVLVSRGLIWVESYWVLSEATTHDWRLDFIAENSDGLGVGRWGVSCDHDPCDWMWPTSRWSKGTIYRDLYALRPPVVKKWQDDVLSLFVGLRSKDGVIDRIKLPIEVPFALSPTEAFAVLRANVPTYKLATDKKLSQLPKVLWDAKQIEQITGGKWITAPPPHWYVGSISHKSNMIFNEDMPEPRMFVATDTKIVARHELYSQFSGKFWDSHQRLVKIQHRLAGTIIARPLPTLRPSLPALQVDDPLHALMQLGVAGRQRLRGKVVAVTGSAGKSSFSAMLAHAMSFDRSVSSNARTNYNSRVGLLHLLANTYEHTDLVIMETAVSAINAPNFQNIKLARPDIAVITNIAPSHLPPGKDLNYIARRKANIFMGVQPEGWAVIYRETHCFELLKSKAVERGLNIVTYGQSLDADFQILKFDPELNAITARTIEGRIVEYAMAARGLHMAINSLACLAVRSILGLEIDDFINNLSTFNSLSGRGENISIDLNGKLINIIDESYNSNPLSMEYALSIFNTLPKHSRKILILGDMLELGDHSIKYHEDLALRVATLKPDCVLACGALMKFFWNALEGIWETDPFGKWYPNVEILQAELAQWLSDGDNVLIKGSNSVGLGKLVKSLQNNDISFSTPT